MSKFGWSLPPGVSVSDIPGNRPEDLAEEVWVDELYGKWAEIRRENGAVPCDELPSDIEALIQWARELWYKRGFNDGEAEGQMNEMARQEARQAEREERED